MTATTPSTEMSAPRTTSYVWYALGLIARCVPPDQLEAEAEKVIGRLANNAPLSLKAMKALTVRQLEIRDHIKHDDVDALVVAGGQESMTNAPHLLEKSRDGYKYGDVTLHDHMAQDGLWDAFTDQAMGLLTETANTGDLAFTREQQDAYAIESAGRAKRAQDSGDFNAEIAPVEVKTGASDGRYTELLWAEAQQTAACNAAHDAASRLCRWLLQVLDRQHGLQELSVTQELIANMLGVRREGVTEAAQRQQ